jgi:hypothetical protein
MGTDSLLAVAAPVAGTLAVLLALAEVFLDWLANPGATVVAARLGARGTRQSG